MATRTVKLAENRSTTDQRETAQFHGYQQSPMGQDDTNGMYDGAYERDSLLGSLARNPQMLNDFYCFIEHTRIRNNNPLQQTSTPFASQGNENATNQQISSTSKRTRTLNESGGTTGNVSKQHKPNNYNKQANQPNQQRSRLPFEQLKHAVSSNLPCFLIEFDSSASGRKPPSAITASRMIEDHLRDQNIHVGNFTLVGWAGSRLKLGVNDKDDYVTLFTTEKWPTSIDNIPISVVKPKFLPDCFALVVRYVPQHVELDMVVQEIQRTINSANNIKQIQYAYERKTRDFRFDVTDLTEYNKALELKRISIGNHWLAITQFLTGNRMTYCTRCWCLGHMRNRCEAANQRCRLCLEDFVNTQQHQCSKQPKCAQCHGDHHSLDSRCEIIRQYKHDLKADVENALENGKLHRIDPAKQTPYFKMDMGDFPEVGNHVPSSLPVWNVPATRQRTQQTVESPDTIKSLLLINENLAVVRESNKRVEEKLDKLDLIMKETALDAQLHQSILNEMLNILSTVVAEVLWPITHRIDQTRLTGPKGLKGQLEKLYELQRTLVKDYESRRRRVTTPTLPSSTTMQAATTNNVDNSNGMNEST